MYTSKHTEDFEKEIQPLDMVKSLCESLVVLQLKICLTEVTSNDF